jgi:hypothetical protein
VTDDFGFYLEIFRIDAVLKLFPGVTGFYLYRYSFIFSGELGLLVKIGPQFGEAPSGLPNDPTWYS